MPNVDVTLGPGLLFQSDDATVTKRTVTLTPPSSTDTVFTVTLGPGNFVAFQGSIAPSLTSSNNSVTVPSSVSLTGSDYVITCTNALTAGAPAATCGFGMTLTVDNKTRTLHDPTMIFDPPG